ncbi:MAG: peptide chain release factor N(5)-glutamine methyltransferase [Phascolarctobacterium sp.]|nr:peptide chain release factor N(5)-glutamine methyltransferase [Phascolarctobacterium sp.]
MAHSVWTIMKILNWTKQYFEAKGVENPRLDAEVLLCAVLKCQRITLYVDFERPLSEEELATYREYVRRRGNFEPLAYILGERAFMRNTFKVNKATLVPRPETELLVESLVRIAPLLKREGDVKILDIGTGSGAIIVSLLDYLPNAKGVGVDISVDALIVAKENSEKIGVTGRIGFVRSDVFSKLPLEKKFDIIVSNPPYIPARDIAGLDKDVQQEPRGALDGGADGLEFYRRITAEAMEHMAEEGVLAFEIGIGQAAAVQQLCLDAGFVKTAVRKDYAGIERMVFAVKAATTTDEAMERYDALLAEAAREL